VHLVFPCVIDTDIYADSCAIVAYVCMYMKLAALLINRNLKNVGFICKTEEAVESGYAPQKNLMLQAPRTFCETLKVSF